MRRELGGVRTGRASVTILDTGTRRGLRLDDAAQPGRVPVGAEVGSGTDRDATWLSSMTEP